MFVLLFPFLAVAVVAALAGRGAPAQSSQPSTPMPIDVLNAFLRQGVKPPPFVVDYAIAQARTIGRFDLAMQLTAAFKTPPQIMNQEPVKNEPAPVRAKTKTAPPPGVMAFAMPDEGSQGVAVDSYESHGDQTDSEPQLQHAVAAGVIHMRSPIPSVQDDRFGELARRLRREAVGFAGPRHVGQYRQNRRRLTELGFDPDVIVERSDMQDEAFRADISDEYKHIVDSGMADETIGQRVALPDGEEQTVTLSGVLGVASVAGLEGAADWFSNRGDRSKFPNTTRAFMTTNGVF